MPKYLIERELEGAEKLSSTDLKNIAVKSCDVLKEMGTDIQWVESYVAENKVYCVYIAKNKELIETHAKKGEFPITKVVEIATIIDPTTSTS